MSIKTKLIGHACFLVVVTVLMSTLASVWLNGDQIRSQNRSRLESAVLRFDRIIGQNIQELKIKFKAFSNKTETAKIMLNCIQQDYFYFPSLPDLFELVPELGLDRYAFYFPPRFTGADRLQIYFDKQLNGLIRVRQGTHTLHQRKGSDIEETRIFDPEIYPEAYPFPEPYEVQSNGKNIQIIAVFEYINMADASDYGSTFKKGERIGYFILEKPIAEDLTTLDIEMGVHVNIFDRNGKVLEGRIQMPDIPTRNPIPINIDEKETALISDILDNQWSLITLTDKFGEKYDAILKPITYINKPIGYVSFSISQATTKAKLLKTVKILSAIGLIAIIFGVSGAFLINRAIVRPINRVVQLARKVALGDLSESADTVKADITRTDEIGIMTHHLIRMTDLIRYVLMEIDNLIQSVHAGKLSSRGNDQKFSGAWKDLIIGINNVLDAFKDPFYRTSSYIDRISAGDIPEKITESYKGDFNTIIWNLNMLIDATQGTTKVAEAIASGNLEVEVRERSERDRMMQALNKMIQRLNDIMNETNRMIAAVGKGRLEIRGNAENFEGGWRDLVSGINDLIEGLSHAVYTAAAIRKEMDLAKEIQTVLIPERPRLTGYEIAANYEPWHEVGGDYYDVISIDGYDWIVIGDVSGHGVTAGLVMMMVQTAIHTVLMENPSIPPSHLLSVVNKVIYKNIEKMNEPKHMTIVVISVENSGTFHFSGLHEMIFIWRCRTGKVDKIQTNGMWIGLEPDISQMLSTNRMTMDTGDCMVLYTDGIIESLSPDDGFFGIERLEHIIEESGSKSASEIREDILDALSNYQKSDDVTLFVIKKL